MLNERLAAAQMVADRLFAAEAKLDETIAEVAMLSAEMPKARADAKVSALFGQDAMENAHGVLAALVEARRRMCETHTALDDVKTGVGLRTRMIGGAYPKPVPEGGSLDVAEPTATDLKLVG